MVPEINNILVSGRKENISLRLRVVLCVPASRSNLFILIVISQGGPLLAAKISPGGPILEGGPKFSLQYTRLPVGVASAPAIFQRTMETLLKDLPMIYVYIDDILVAGITPQDHLNNLAAVLSRLQEAGLRLKKVKCSFCAYEVEYLGHIIRPAQKYIDIL